jgi:hypothetical protein
MTTRFLFKPICLAFAIFICFYASGQNTHSFPNPLRSRQIEVDTFRWQMDDSINHANVTLTITNKSKFDVQSVTITLAAENKQGIMLQSGRTRTLKMNTVEHILEPQQKDTYVFNRAFNNPQIDSLMLKQIKVQFANGSIEILN